MSDLSWLTDPLFAARFWSKVDVGRPGQCWIWRRSRQRNTYGQIYRGGRLALSHRTAWELINGPMPDDAKACHTCDNPPCCNPSHIFMGTQADNVRDMVAKGRAAGPVRIPRRSVEDIRARYHTYTIPGAPGLFSNAQELADEFGISKPYIHALVANRYRKEIA